MSQEIGNLQVTLEAQTASFEKGMASAIKSIQKMENQIKESNTAFGQVNQQFQSITTAVNSLGTAFAALGGLGYLKGLIDTADAASDLGAAFGLAIDQVYAYQRTILAAGGKLDGFDKIMSKVSSNVTDAFAGVKSARDGFDQLGISLQSIQDKGVGEIFDQIAIALAKISDPAKRNAIALDLLGKSALGVDWVKYAAEIEATKAKYEALAPALQRAADASDKLTLAVKDFGTWATAALGGIPDAIKMIGQGFEDLYAVITGKKTLEEAMRNTTEETKKTDEAVQSVSRTIQQLQGASNPFNDWVKGLQKSTVEADLFQKKMEYLDAQMRKATTSNEIKVIQAELEKLNGKNPFEAWKDSVDAASVQADLLVPKLEYLAELRNNEMISLAQYTSEIEKLGYSTKAQTDDVDKMFQGLQQSLAGFGQQFSSQFIDNLVAGTATMENFFADLTKMIAKFMLNQVVQKFITMMMGGIFGGPAGAAAGGAMGGGIFGDSASYNPNEVSNTRMGSDSVSGFSLGANRLSMSIASLNQSMGSMPSMANVAARPRQDVIAQPPMNVVINNTISGDTKVTAAETTNSDGGKQLTIMVEKTVKELFGTGAMDKSMRASYGLVRAAQ